LRLKGRGLPGKRPGDLYAELQIVIPPASSEKARAAWRELQRQFDFDPRAGMEVGSR
jgi:curved DNA-binding protein